jgi:hypothetical protein
MGTAANTSMDRTNGAMQRFPAPLRGLHRMYPGSLRDSMDGVLNAVIVFGLQQILKILLMARRFNY